jgi:hypothetical protein
VKSRYINVTPVMNNKYGINQCDCCSSQFTNFYIPGITVNKRLKRDNAFGRKSFFGPVKIWSKQAAEEHCSWFSYHVTVADCKRCDAWEFWREYTTTSPSSCEKPKTIPNPLSTCMTQLRFSSFWFPEFFCPCPYLLLVNLDHVALFYRIN